MIQSSREDKLAAGLVSILREQARRLASVKKRVESDLKNGCVIENIPMSEWSVWFRILKFFAILLGLNLTPPSRRRLISVSERHCLQEKVGKLDETLSRIEIELERALRSPELRPLPFGLLDRDDGYPDDWAQISLQYRRRVRFVCEDCGVYAPDGHVHHIVPVSRGGGSNDDNLLFLCKSCHTLQHPHMKEY